jgi:hypothetical protein
MHVSDDRFQAESECCNLILLGSGHHNLHQITSAEFKVEKSG